MSLSIGFLLKKALGAIVLPLTVSLLFSATGFLYIVLRRFRDSIAPFAIGAMLLYACSLTTVAGHMVRPLERMFPPLNLSRPEIAAKPVKWVVVLGSGHWTDASLSATAMLGDAGLYRLTEGIRVANAYPGAVLILSGGRYKDEQSNAQVMARSAVELGFDPSRIVLSDESLDTEDEAAHIASMVGGDACVLVTSAAHMMRAVKLFEGKGVKPLPAPTNYRFRGEPEDFIPEPENLTTCHLAVHEYLGLAWGMLRGQISLP